MYLTILVTDQLNIKVAVIFVQVFIFIFQQAVLLATIVNSSFITNNEIFYWYV